MTSNRRLISTAISSWGVLGLLVAIIVGYFYYYYSDGQEEAFSCQLVMKHLPAIAIPRPSGSTGSLRVQSYIKSQFTAKYWDFQEDAHRVDETPLGPITFRNLIFTHRPSHQGNPGAKIILLAAHYDSKVLEAHGVQPATLSPELIESSEFVGATDAALSCALIVALARSLQNLHLRHPLQIVFFDGEEAMHNWSPTDSLYGSRRLAQKWRQEKGGAPLSEHIQLMILLDLLGAPTPPFIYSFHPVGTHLHSHFQRLLAIQERLAPPQPVLSASLQFSHLRGQAVEDDHTPFQEQNVPVLHLIPVPFPRVWHTPADDLSAVDEVSTCLISHIIHEYLLDLLTK